MSSSAWSKKLETKLSVLSDTSSKETCQTIATWIGFNRKHIESFCPVLLDALKSTKQLPVLTVIYELLLVERGTAEKWDRLSDMRLHVGEQVLLKSVDDLTSAGKDRVLLSLKDWEDANVFSERPTFTEQLRKVLKQQTAAGEGSPTKSPAEPKEAPTSTPKPDRSPVSANDDDKPSAKEADQPDEPLTVEDASSMEILPTAVPPPRTLERSSTETLVDAPYDFESRGIAAATVDPTDLLQPSRLIATYQIGRDLRNDSAVQLSALLTGLPEDVQRVVVEAAEAEGDEYPLPEAQAHDFSIRIPASLIDMDFNEQMQDVKLFRELVVKQQVERQKLIELLVKSRCDFGANDAAAAFLKADRAMEQLAKRKQILLDAMELEGVDVIETNTKDKVELEELPPLTWYSPEASNEPETPEAKRQRTE